MHDTNISAGSTRTIQLSSLVAVPLGNTGMFHCLLQRQPTPLAYDCQSGISGNNFLTLYNACSLFNDEY